MSLESIVIVLALVVFAGAVFWWLIFTTEGVYLGRRVVIWLYDVYALRYDRIKNYDTALEAATLGRPLLRALIDIPAPLVLDVATGTARLPLALFGQPAFNGYVFGLDYSRRMLTVAAEKIEPLGHRVQLIYQHAQALPFDDDTFDAVTCLEALEFMPDPDAVIAELVRVVRPGGLILITNRRGVDARMMPGKTQSLETLVANLRSHFGLTSIVTNIWQMDYDQVWAYKPGNAAPAPEHALEAVLRCPTCGKRTCEPVAESVPDPNHDRKSSDLRCATCQTRIPVGSDGVLEYSNAASATRH